MQYLSGSLVVLCGPPGLLQDVAQAFEVCRLKVDWNLQALHYRQDHEKGLLEKAISQLDWLLLRAKSGTGLCGRNAVGWRASPTPVTIE